MLLDLAFSFILFVSVSCGIGWPLAVKLTADPAERLLASVMLSLVLSWLGAWLIFVADLPRVTLWLLPVLAMAGLCAGRPALQTIWHNPVARDIAIAQLLVTTWCVIWQSWIISYSGGGWSGDWFEHWERSRFFLHDWPKDFLFIGQYPLPARPPLANVLTGAWMHLTQVDFAHYQLFSTCFSSLAFLPAVLLAHRFGGGRSVIWVAAVVMMLNPLFVQNATFPWTKLPGAFFVLAGIHFFLAVDGRQPSLQDGLLWSVALAAGLLTHYSAAPYAIILAIAWFIRGSRTWDRLRFYKATLAAVGAGTVLLGTWLGWSIATYGFVETFSTNTTITASESTAVAQLKRVGLNLRDTIVPHFLRSPDPGLITQSSAWGSWRDWFFQSYQLNLVFAFGSVGWYILIREGWRAARAQRLMAGLSWMACIAAVTLLAIAAHGARDEWGLAHVCLQPLVLFGLAFLASRWNQLRRPWHLVLIGGMALDFGAGILLHFSVQNFMLDRWLTPELPPLEVITSYGAIASHNAMTLAYHQLTTLGEQSALPPVASLALALAVLLACLRRAARSVS